MLSAMLGGENDTLVLWLPGYQYYCYMALINAFVADCGGLDCNIIMGCIFIPKSCHFFWKNQHANFVLLGFLKRPAISNSAMLESS